MGYDRYPRGSDSQGDYGRRDTQDYGRDYGSGRDYGYSSARDYAAAGSFDRDRGGRDRDDSRGSYGQRDDRYGSYGRDQEQGYGRDRSYGGQQSGGQQYGGRGGGQRYGGDRYGQPSGGQRYGAQQYGQSGGQARYAQGDEYHGSYASDGHRWEDVGSRRHADDDNYARNRNDGRGGVYQNRDRGYDNRDDRRGGGYSGQPQGYDYDDRGFLARAGDEVRSWFGDEDAERRREMDSRYDDRAYGQGDDHYHSWRSGQIAALDRDYDEYRNENRSKFENEFSSWRSQRQTQRDSLDRVKEHDEVLGSDGSHVGTVDKVRGDRILLTKNDADAGGQHHSIPSRWIQSVEDKKVTLSKTADEAKQQWRAEEKNQAMFRYGDNVRGDGTRTAQSSASASGGTAAGTASSGAQASGSDDGAHKLNRSFSGTY
jgi:hypothetical protein